LRVTRTAAGIPTPPDYSRHHAPLALSASGTLRGGRAGSARKSQGSAASDAAAHNDIANGVAPTPAAAAAAITEPAVSPMLKATLYDPIAAPCVPDRRQAPEPIGKPADRHAYEQRGNRTSAQDESDFTRRDMRADQGQRQQREPRRPPNESNTGGSSRKHDVWETKLNAFCHPWARFDPKRARSRNKAHC
jgi:hypothetical protein